jgi:hypothetical protein
MKIMYKKKRADKRKYVVDIEKAEYKASRDRFTHKKLLYTHNIIEVLCNAFSHSSFILNENLQYCSFTLTLFMTSFSDSD